MTFLPLLGVWIKSNPLPSALIAALAAVLIYCGYLEWNNHTLRADLAEAKLVIQVVESTKDRYLLAANAAAELADKLDRDRNPRFNAAERIVRNAPSSALTATDYAVRACLLSLRANGSCAIAAEINKAATGP